ncbi:MAG: hypothetical protein IJ228_08655 [Succinivibrio sp.]|nr:hypothetical protein [Succinivibrio sp.]
MLYLSGREVTSLLEHGLDQTVTAMQEVFRLIGKGQYALGGALKASHGLQLKYRVQDETALYIAMPGHLGGEQQLTGVKFHGPMNAALSPERESNYLVVLTDAVTGEPLCLMNANALTAYRTAAVNILAADYLSSESADTLGIVGPGRINTLVALGILERHPRIGKVLVLGRGTASLKAFVQSVSARYPEVKVQPAGSLQELVIQSAVISIMTGFKFKEVADMPRIRAQWLRPCSAVLCGAFAYFPESLLTGNCCLICDLFDMYRSYRHELGEPAYSKLSYLGNKLADLVASGRLPREEIHDLSAIISHPELISRPYPRLFSGGGLALEDLMLAQILYKKALAQGIGTALEYE